MSKASARICLAGEDLDWTGGRSILYGLDLKLEVNISMLDESADYIFINSNKVNGTMKIKLNDILNYKYTDSFYNYIIAGIRVFNKHHKNIKAMKIEIISEVPIKSGLSSSAALLVAFFKELFLRYNIKYDVSNIINLCYETEHYELNSTVGKMDFYSCLEGYKKILVYDGKVDKVNVLDFLFDSDVHTVLIYTGNSTSTKQVNISKNNRFMKKEVDFMYYLESGNKIVNEMIEQFNNKVDINEIGKSITKYHTIMDKYLKVTNESINDCVKICLNMGALGAKLTGCGLGGYVFCLIKDDKLKNLLDELEKKKYDYIVCNN
ncbi:MAG: hypothetical protein E7214_09355 [Clostridium sp.]|nr:hypothetical protein [Clostridium sp.]